MTYLFTPPQRTMTTIIHGRALRYSYPVSWTVWQDSSGAWQAQEVPSNDTLLAAKVILRAGGRPALVDDATATSLQAWINSYTPPPGISAPTLVAVQP